MPLPLKYCATNHEADNPADSILCCLQDVCVPPSGAYDALYAWLERSSSPKVCLLGLVSLTNISGRSFPGAFAERLCCRRRLMQRHKTASPTRKRHPTAAPTPIPALTPELRPDEDDEDGPVSCGRFDAEPGEGVGVNGTLNCFAIDVAYAAGNRERSFACQAIETGRATAVPVVMVVAFTISVSSPSILVWR